MPSPNMNKAIGALEARMDSHEERLQRMEDKIDKLVETVASSKGGLKTLITLGTVVAGIAASVTELIHFGIGRH